MLPNSDITHDALARLQQTLIPYQSLTVAVSGGVDSMTLAFVADSVLHHQVTMTHAVSPAVPIESTERVKRYAEQYGWQLEIIDAKEFADSRYRDNPVNRCYFCKSNLYSRIREHYKGVIASGANLDDLGDYRPGLLAASEQGVVHPFVDARITKPILRSIARLYHLTDIAELPAQPCLSSRVETGIKINANDLGFIHRIERYIATELGQGDIRCRVTARGVRIEVDEALTRQSGDHWQVVQKTVHAIVESEGRSIDHFSAYQRGSAFLKSAE